MILKYIRLLYLYYFNVDPNYYNNINFLKKVIIGFNYYQQQYIGEILIPNDCSLRLFNLWVEIINSNKDYLSNLETLLVITTNIISNINNLYYQNIRHCLILNLFI